MFAPQSKPKTRPGIERLEGRDCPGYAWGSFVTYSFVPDGTQWLGGPSTLNADMAARRADWRDQIRRAMAEWSRALGLMFVEVKDDGKPLGAESPTIRIGGNRESSPVLARAYFPAPGHGSDITLNTAHDWGGGVDIFSVALHELGHAVADLKDGASPVMSGTYQGVLPGLTPADVDAALASVTVDRGPAAILSKFGERL